MPLPMAVKCVLGLAAAGLLVAALILVPPYLQDEEAFDQAKRKNTVESYRDYLKYGGKNHRDEVAGKLLPEAALAHGRRYGLAHVYLENLDAMQGTPAMARFESEFDDLHRKARAEFRERTRPADPARTVWIGHLLDWLQKNRQTDVEVVFKHPDTSALAELDSGLKAMSDLEMAALSKRSPQVAMRQVLVTTQESSHRSTLEFGSFAPSAPAFAREHCENREPALVDGLQGGFDYLGLRPVVHLVRAPAPPSTQAVRPRVSVQYSLDRSGTSYRLGSIDANYIGIRVRLISRLTVPGVTGESVTELEVEPSEHIVIHGKQRPDYRGTASSSEIVMTVYDALARNAFRHLKAVFAEIYTGKKPPPGTGMYDI